MEAKIGSDSRSKLYRTDTLMTLSRHLTESLDIKKEISDLKCIINDKQSDNEMIQMAKDDINTCKDKLTMLDTQMTELLIPTNFEDTSDAIMEITTGVGGQEAMLFANDLFHMYFNFVVFKKWRISSYEVDENDLGGIRKGSINITGKNVYGALKFEGGVHRVQRVPKTEKTGRIHTSTVAVAVLPKPTEIQFELNPNDLKIETKRASGAGGQHVNTTDSAVRIVHIPTGIIVENQTDRSQLQNKKSALGKLRALLYQRELDERNKSQTQSRKLQVGLSGRSEKIRTYNFLQDRVTDHRIGLSVQNLMGVLDGRLYLEQVVLKLQDYEKQEKLENLIQSANEMLQKK
uniref:Prokaryotic-type class I peptide chain release factors domain-containing protein n=1 Tax=Strigamia maritima TaxID=126957 RepID=T1JIE3_STRMM